MIPIPKVDTSKAEFIGNREQTECGLLNQPTKNFSISRIMRPVSMADTCRRQKYVVETRADSVNSRAVCKLSKL
jgi:hypothetical protein